LRRRQDGRRFFYRIECACFRLSPLIGTAKGRSERFADWTGAGEIDQVLKQKISVESVEILTHTALSVTLIEDNSTQRIPQ